MNTLSRMVLGTGAGVLATIPMTLAMKLMHVHLPGESGEPLPPRQVTSAIADRVGAGHRMDEEDHEQATAVAHFAYGAASGAALAPLAAVVPVPTIVTGLVFGLGLWAASYMGWLPATGVRHHARHDPPARNALMIAAHVIWGTTAGTLIGAAQGRSRQARASTRDPARA